MKKEEIREIEAMLVILAQRIEDLRRKTIGGGTTQSEQNWLNELRKDAQRISQKIS